VAIASAVAFAPVAANALTITIINHHHIIAIIITHHIINTTKFMENWRPPQWVGRLLRMSSRFFTLA